MKNSYADMDSIIIYGAGRLGEHVCRIILEGGGKPLFFCDKAVGEIGEELLGIPVMRPDDISQYISSDIFLAVGVSFYEVKNHLENMGFKNIHTVEKLITQPVENGLTPSEINYYSHIYDKTMGYDSKLEWAMILN